MASLRGITLGRTARSLTLLLLVTAYPFLSFWTNNLDETSPLTLARYGALAFSGVALGYLILVALFRPRTGRLTAACAVLVIGGFSFHGLTSAFGGLAGAHDHSGLPLLAWLTATTGGLALALWLGPRPGFHRFLLVFAVARLALPLASLIAPPHLASGSAPSATDFAYSLDDNPIWSGTPVRRPDIYWFVFDSYPNDRVLSEIYAFDNRPLLRFLSLNGFHVARRSHANFNKTKVSMATALNMENAFEAGDAYAEIRAGQRHWLPGNTRSGLSAAVAGDNRSVSFLKQSGYAYVHFDNRYWPVFRCRGFEDVCIRGVLDGPSELESALLELTPIPAIRDLFDSAGAARVRSEAMPWATSGTGVPEFGDALARLELSGPRFVYAHFTAPHPPFLNANDCRRLPKLSLDPLDFKSQLQCVNQHLQSLVTQVLKDDPEAIVLVSGDHGPRLLDVEADMSQLSGIHLRERLGILSALRLPAECRAGLRQTLAPVNFMRIVFACLGGHPPRLTPERYFLVPESLADDRFDSVRAVAPHAD